MWYFWLFSFVIVSIHSFFLYDAVVRKMSNSYFALQAVFFILNGYVLYSLYNMLVVLPK